MKLSFILLLFSKALLFTQISCTDEISSVTLNGSYAWELLMDVDNSKNSASVTRHVEVTTVVSCSYDSMVKELQTSEVAASLGFGLDGTLFDVIGIGMKSDFSYEVKSQYEKVTQTKQEYKNTTVTINKYEIGPRSRMRLFRLVFSAPGVSYFTDTISTNDSAPPVVPIEFRIRNTLMLKGIDVVYSDDSVSRPDGYIAEARGLSPDVNKDFKGKYVFLLPVWTKIIEEGVTGIQVAIQADKNDNYKDLAAGAGGKYRYLKMLKDPYSRRRITEVKLWRADESGDLPVGNGFQYQTTDINEERKHDYLYLALNTRLV